MRSSYKIADADRRLSAVDGSGTLKRGPPPNASAVYVVTFFLGLAAGLLWYRIWQDAAFTGGQTQATCVRGRLLSENVSVSNFTVDLNNFADAAEYHTRLEMTCYFPVTPYLCTDPPACTSHEAVPLDDRPVFHHRTGVKCNAGVWGEEKCSDLDWSCTSPGYLTGERRCSAWEKAIALCADALEASSVPRSCYVVPGFPSLGVRADVSVLPAIGVTLAVLFSIATIASCTWFFWMMGCMRKSESITWLLTPICFALFVIFITWLWHHLCPHPPSITKRVAEARAEVDLEEPPATFGYGHEALDMGLAVIMTCAAVCVCLCCAPCARTFTPEETEEDEEEETESQEIE